VNRAGLQIKKEWQAVQPVSLETGHRWAERVVAPEGPKKVAGGGARRNHRTIAGRESPAPEGRKKRARSPEPFLLELHRATCLKLHREACVEGIRDASRAPSGAQPFLGGVDRRFLYAPPPATFSRPSGTIRPRRLQEREPGDSQLTKNQQVYRVACPFCPAPTCTKGQLQDLRGKGSLAIDGNRPFQDLPRR
jgi:hypothetical protein